VRSSRSLRIPDSRRRSGRFEHAAGVRLPGAHRSVASSIAFGLVLCSMLLPTVAGALDRGADGQFSKRRSAHFEMLQDVAIDQTGGFNGSRRFEQQVLAELERAYDRLDDLLGLRPDRRIEVVIYDDGVFDRQFAGLFRFAAAGFYHGVIRVRGATTLTVGLSRVLHHELVHAAMDMAAPSYRPPAWLNEGLAEWFEARALGKRRLNRAEWSLLAQAYGRGALFPLAALSTPSFGNFGEGSAQIAYLQSYAMVDFLARISGEGSLREICDGLIRTRDLDRTIRRVYRDDLGRLEERFFDQLG